MIVLRLPEILSNALGVGSLRCPDQTVARAVRGAGTRLPAFLEMAESLDWRLQVDGRDVGLHTSLPDGAVVDLVPVYGGAGPIGKILGGAFLTAAGAGTGAAGVALTGLSFVGLGILQHLSPRPPPDFMEQESPENRTSYLASRVGNLAEAGQPVPICYGETLCGSVRVSGGTAVTDTSISQVEDGATIGPIQLSAEERFWVVDVVSEGEVEGLATSNADSIYLDGVPVGRNGVPSIEGFAFVEVPGLDPSPGGYQIPVGVSRPVAVGAKVTKEWTSPADKAAGSVERTITDPAVTDLLISVEVSALYYRHPNGRLEAEEVEMGVEVRGQDGVWRQPTTSLSAFYLDEMAHDADGLGSTLTSTDETDVTRIKEEWYTVTIAPTPPPTLNLTWRYRVVGAGTWTDVPVVGTLVPTTEVPWLDEYPSATGYYYFTVQTPELAPGQYETERSPAGAGDFWVRRWVRNPRILIRGFTLDPYRRDAEVRIVDVGQGGGPYDVRVFRQTDHRSDRYFDECFWADYSEEISEDLRYDGTALVYVEASVLGLLEQNYGSADVRVQYQLRGRKLRVPYLYDPDAADPWASCSPTWPIPQGGDPVWDAAAKWTNNPALILLDMLTFGRGGIGLEDAQVDLYSIGDAARRADGLVSDGAGGTERRYLFDHQFLGASEGLRAISLVAQSMDAKLWWGDGQVWVTQDRPASAVRLFNPENVVDGVFNYASQPREAIYSVSITSYRDRERQWANTTDREAREYLLDRYGYRESRDRTIGLSRRTEARRRNRYVLETSQLGTLVTFSTGPEGNVVRPGDIIQISDPYWEPVRAGGRTKNDITGPGGTGVHLDVPFPFEAGKTYTLHIMDLEAGFAVHEIVNPGAPASHITLATPFVNGIGAHATYIITEAGELAIREFRVAAVRELDPFTFEVSATIHDPDIYARVEDLSEIDRGWPYPIP